MSSFRYDAHPMPMLISTIASLSTFHPEANPALVSHSMYMKEKRTDRCDEMQFSRAENYRQKAIFRMLGKVPTIAAHSYRVS